MKINKVIKVTFTQNYIQIILPKFLIIIIFNKNHLILYTINYSNILIVITYTLLNKKYDKTNCFGALQTAVITDTLWSGAGPSEASVPQPKDVRFFKIRVTSSDSRFDFFIYGWILMGLSSKGSLCPKNDLHQVPPESTLKKSLKIVKLLVINF